MNDKLVFMLLLEGVIMLAPLLFSLADLLSGVRKARVRGEELTSSKYRRTVNKLARYYNVMLALGLIDALQLFCIWYLDSFSDWELIMFPWLTMVGSFGIGAIETKSIIEPANKKESEDLTKVTLLAKEIVQRSTNPKELAQAIVEYINKGDNEKQQYSI